MSWATSHIAGLVAGKTVSFRPQGRSMEPIILSGQLCTCKPVSDLKLGLGDVVLCHVAGSDYLHKIVRLEGGDAEEPARYQIGNNRGRINGWVTKEKIYGKLIRIES